MTEISLKQIGEGVLTRCAGRDEPEARVRAYAALLAALSFIFASAFLAGGYGLESPFAVGALCVAAALAQRGQVQVSGALKVSISLFPILLAAVLVRADRGDGCLGLLDVGRANRAGHEVGCLRIESFADGRGGWLDRAELGRRESRVDSGRYRRCAVCMQALDLVFAAIVFTLRGHGSPSQSFREMGPLSLTALPVYVPGVALLAFGYQRFPPGFFLCSSLRRLPRRDRSCSTKRSGRLANDLAEVNKHLERANLSFATALVATLDARDRYTAGHSAAVAIYARDIAARMGLPPEQGQLAHVCGLVHDIGKIGLPPGLLEKPGALTLDERRQMEEHSEISGAHPRERRRLRGDREDRSPPP